MSHCWINRISARILQATAYISFVPCCTSWFKPDLISLRLYSMPDDQVRLSWLNKCHSLMPPLFQYLAYTLPGITAVLVLHPLPIGGFWIRPGVQEQPTHTGRRQHYFSVSTNLLSTSFSTSSSSNRNLTHSVFPSPFQVSCTSAL